MLTAISTQSKTGKQEEDVTWPAGRIRQGVLCGNARRPCQAGCVTQRATNDCSTYPEDPLGYGGLKLQEAGRIAVQAV